MPWHLMPYSCSALMAKTMSSTLWDLATNFERGLVDGLQTEVDQPAAGAVHEVQQLRVARHVGAHLRRTTHDEALVDDHRSSALSRLRLAAKLSS